MHKFSPYYKFPITFPANLLEQYCRIAFPISTLSHSEIGPRFRLRHRSHRNQIIRLPNFQSNQRAYTIIRKAHNHQLFSLLGCLALNPHSVLQSRLIRLVNTTSAVAGMCLPQEEVVALQGGWLAIPFACGRHFLELL